MPWWLDDPFRTWKGVPKKNGSMVGFFGRGFFTPQKKRELFWAARWSTQKKTWDPSRRCGLTIHCQFPGSYHHPVASDRVPQRNGWMLALWEETWNLFIVAKWHWKYFLQRFTPVCDHVKTRLGGHAKIWDMALLLDVYFRSTLRFTHVIFHKQHQKSHQNLNSNLCLKKLQYSSQSPFKKISTPQSPFSPYNLGVWLINSLHRSTTTTLRPSKHRWSSNTQGEGLRKPSLVNQHPPKRPPLRNRGLIRPY